MNKVKGIVGVVVACAIGGGFMMDYQYKKNVDEAVLNVQQEFVNQGIVLSYKNIDRNIFSNNIVLEEIEFKEKSQTIASIESIIVDRNSFSKDDTGKIPYFNIDIKNARIENPMIQMMFQSAVKFDLKYHYNYNDTDQSLTSLIDFDIDNIGRVYFDTSILDAKDLWTYSTNRVSNELDGKRTSDPKNTEDMKKIMGDAKVNGSTISFENKGFFDLMSKINNNKTWDELKDETSRAILSNRVLDENVKIKLNDFVFNPKKIELIIDPVKPVSFDEIVNVFEPQKSESETIKDLEMLLGIKLNINN